MDFTFVVDVNLSVKMPGDSKKIPKFNLKEKSYEQYKLELELWLAITSVEKKNQAVEVILSLPDASQDEFKLKELCLAKFTKAELTGEDSIDNLIKFMDSQLGKDDIGLLWEKYVKFDELQRKDESISEYISNFDVRYNALSKLKVVLPQEILAFMMLRKANLTSDETKLIMTGLDYKQKNTLYDQAKCSLRKFKGDHASGITSVSAQSRSEGLCVPQIKQEVFTAEAEVYDYENAETGVYAARGNFSSRNGRGGPPRFGGSRRGSEFQNNRRGQPGRNRGFSRGGSRLDSAGRKVNPKGRNGEYLRCHNCDSFRHLLAECTEVYQSQVRKESDDIVVLYTGAAYVSDLNVEAANCAVLDSACSHTVCGRKWLDYYLSSLSEELRVKVKMFPSNREFRFGGGERLVSTTLYHLPAVLAGKSVIIQTDCVSSDIPLLMSLKSMKKAGIDLHLSYDTATVFGKTVNLNFTSCGHYCLPLINEECVDMESVAEAFKVTIPEGEKKRSLLKLHRQFAHPSNQKLSELLKNAKCWKPDFGRMLEEIRNNCEFCIKFKRTPSRPVVCMPMASRFNQIVTLDLKKWGNEWICYIIDLFSRLTIGRRIQRKFPCEVVQAVMSGWLAVGYGSPEEILIDNGGEFTAEEIKEVTSVLNIKVNTTAANSPFSNGVCERNHAVVDSMLLKLQAEHPEMSLDDLLSWACTAKNSLCMFAGFSPYQIVFGKNPTLPGLGETHPPSTNEIQGDMLMKHLKALNSARKAFVEAEASERVKRALRHKIRISERNYSPGDVVYYKKEGCVQWKGPAKVVFQDGKLVFIRHGASIIRVYVNRVVLRGEEYGKADVEGETSKFKSCENSVERGHDSPVECDRESVVSDHDDEAEIMSGEQPVCLPNTGQSESVKVTPHGSVDNDYLSWKNVKVNDNICFRCENSDSWTSGKVVSRAGKATGKYASWFNIETDTDRQSVDLSRVELRTGVSSQNQEKSNENIDVNSENLDVSKNVDSENFDVLENIDTQTSESIECENPEKAACESENSVYTVSVDRNSVVYKSNQVCQKTVEAQLAEVQKLKDFETYQVVDDVGQDRVSTRWVITDKSDGQKRARLVARGFEEDNEIQSDSPTVTKSVIKLFLALCVSFQWLVKSTDIKSAFLQGKDMDRDLYIQPPKGFETPGKLWKLKKCLYGLNDAARKFYLSVKESLVSLGCVVSNLEPAIFVYCVNGTVHGLIVCHVDDFLHAGSELFEKNVIKKLTEQYQASKQEDTDFVYVGLNLKQRNDQICVSQDDYLSTVEPVTISAARAKQKGCELNSEEYSQFRSMVGKINWLSQGSRPDCSFDMINLSTKFTSAHVGHLVESVKVVKKLKNESVRLVFSDLGPPECWKLLLFTDASLANLNGVESCGGMVLFLVGEENKCCPISWHSGKLKRVVRSTLSAETMSLVNGLEEALYMKELIKMCAKTEVEIHAIVDNKSLVQALGSTSLVDDKRLRIDISSIKEIIENEGVRVSWVPGKGQLANCLTKRGASSKDLMEVLCRGKLSENYC